MSVSFRASLATALLLAFPAYSAPDRLAVVVGNQDYARAPDLTNANADAKRVAAMLRDLGFEVFEGHDLDRQGFEDLMRRAILNTEDGAEIVFFYAGHGIQIGRRNYLLPVDAAFESVYDLPVQSVTLDRVIDTLSARGQVHVAIIDACRDNPFPDKMLAGNLDASLFETRSGFDVFQTPINSLVAFSTAPGMVAYDGPEGGNSPYSAAVVEAVETMPEADAVGVFAKVREAVFEKTSGKQVPWESSTLVRPFKFRRAPRSALQLVAFDDPPETPAATPQAITLRAEFGRSIDLTKPMSQALGQAGAMDVTVAEGPRQGVLDVGEGGLTYQPVLTEQRAETRSLALADAFTLTVAQNGAQVPVDVTLDLTVNDCDMAAGDALDPGGVGVFRLNNEIDVQAALAACRAAVEAHPDTSRFRHQLGRAQQAAGLYREAYDSFEAAANAGHIRSLNALGLMLVPGRIDHAVHDVPQDAARAMELWQQGADKGDPFAMHSLGKRLLTEGETQADRERGFELLDRAAELGHTFSMNELGFYFLKKNSDHFIPERGMNYLNASAQRGDIYGHHNLGLVALYGIVGEPDLDEARRRFEIAAEGGHPKSPATLGRMILRDQIPGQGAAKAVEWYDLGLSRGDGWGGVNAAELILGGQVSGSPADALVRAAKALPLRDEKAAAAARELLAKQSQGDLSRAIQTLLRDLGAQVSVDGAIGPQTRGALERMAQEAGLPVPPGDRLAQLETAARLFWAQKPNRPDLF